SVPVITLVWGLVGSRLKGTYDRHMIESLIGERILEMVDELVEHGTKLVTLNPGKTSGQRVEPPVTLGSEGGTALAPTDISGIGRTIEKKILRETIDKGLQEILRQQATIFLRKLEERYFFKQYYQLNPSRYMGLEAQQAIEEVLAREKGALTRQVL